MESRELQDQINELTREREAFINKEKMFHALVETAVGDIGEDFFNNIVRKLSEWLNAECVIIGQLVRDNVVEGFPMYLDGQIIQGFSYNLKGTPCDLTSKKGYCIYPTDVISFFPESKDLIDLNIAGYVGTALYNKQNEPNGILCAMSRTQLNLPPQAEDIMRIVGSRITAEIERIKIQKAFEISEAKLRKANAAKDRFLTIIAHDLKTPFNSLIGYSELLIEDIQNKNFEKIDIYAHHINKVSSQTFNLLKNLLEWSLTQTGNTSCNPEYFKLLDITNEVIAFQTDFADQKKISLSSTIPDMLIVFADKNMITTIIRNLISNAIKYTNVGGKISLSAIADQEKTKITVTDTGIGITDRNLDKLFRIDENFSTAGTANEKGTGLGLILCKEFTESHHGEIWVESEVGKGSIFSFTIPNH